LPETGPIGAIATSIRGAAHLENTISVVGEHGLGVFVDTEAWRTQLEPDDPARAEEFRRVGLDWTPNRRFVPSEATVSGADRNQIVASHRDTQVSAGGTLLVSPCHRVRETAPLSRGRRLDIALAHDFTALARSSGGAHPTPQGGLPRSVAVALAVDARTLEPKVIEELIAGYREVDADLFWIWVWNFDPNGKQYGRVRSLAGGLQNASQTPCLLGGIGGLYEAALRNQVAAVCQGWGRSQLKFPPPDPPEVVEDEDEDAGWGVHVFHPGILGTTKIGVDKHGVDNEAPLRRLFRLQPCHCRHHRPDEVPAAQPDRHAHNRHCVEEARGRRFASIPPSPAPSSPRSSQRLKKCVLGWSSVLYGRGGARPQKTSRWPRGSSCRPIFGDAAPSERLL
jgi:hypothetical protein